MRRGGPETAGDGLPWPDAAQAQLLKAVIGPADGIREAFSHWQAMTDLEADLDGGTFRLLPLLYSRTSAQKLDDAVMSRLKGVYRMAWCETHNLLNTTTPALKALADANIPTLLLKGVPLALHYYRSHATRPMCDMDIVVSPQDLPRALAVLQSAGWTPSTPLRPEAVNYTHAAGLKNALDEERIDLHWHCLRERLYESSDSWFWSSAQPLQVGDTSTLQPSATAMLLHVIIHGTRSNMEPPIRWVADASTIIQSSGDAIDWQELLRFSRQHKLSRRLYLGLDHLSTQYGITIPAEVLESLKQRGTSLDERIENLSYLGRTHQPFFRLIHMLSNYWRYRRRQNFLFLLLAIPDYLVFKWNLSGKSEIPLTMVRKIFRKPPRPAESR